MSITCEQFENLMSFYLDNELGENIKHAFEAHLKTCKKCREKYYTFKEIIIGLRNTYKSMNYSTHSRKEISTDNKIINSRISAYADNELDINENIKIKKMIISKPEIREKVENIYSLKHLMKSCFDKTQLKEDYSKKLIKKIYKKSYTHNKDLIFALISFIVLSIVWVIMLFASIYP